MHGFVTEVRDSDIPIDCIGIESQHNTIKEQDFVGFHYYSTQPRFTTPNS
ncbi:MAG: hypothetical protein F6K40_36820 [Okeania sp. SIO3I5]|nr:hypothetical protein [Okeania sp. SIO3I5]NEQ41460.1 hypothetical protein [Okeania sp. SIO3I5]